MSRTASAGSNGRGHRRHALLLTAAIMAVLLGLTHRSIQGQNALSRLVAVDSLALRGEFHIDGSPLTHRLVEREGHVTHALVDMVYNRDDGHFYSSKPPVYTMILAIGPALARVLGVEFSLTNPTNPVALVLLTWVVVGGLTGCTFYIFRRYVGQHVAPLKADLVTLLTLGGTLFLSYSTSINHHTVTAALILFAFVGLRLPSGAGRIGDGQAALAGFLLGLATVVDIGHGVFFGFAVGMYLLCFNRSLRPLLFFALGSVPPLATHCIVQYATWGSILPVQMIPGTRDYTHSYWANCAGPDAWDIPRSRYCFLTLFSMHGMFVLSPILLVGVARILADVGSSLSREWEQARNSRLILLRPVTGSGQGYAALSVLFVVCALVAYYSLVPKTHFGGACYGMRWYIGFAPVLALYAAKGYMAWHRSKVFRVAFYLAGVWSCFYALIGTQVLWVQMELVDHPAFRLLLPLRGF